VKIWPETSFSKQRPIVGALLAASPAWRVQIFDGSADRLLELLVAGQIDLLLGRLPSGAANGKSIDDLAQRVLYQGRLAVVASKSHPLSRRSKVPMEALFAWPWVLPSMQSTTRVALVDAFLRCGLAPPVPVVESPSFFYSLSLLAHTDLLTCWAHSAALASSESSILP
jgi:DNA-binding transcriptional LysR family regulator